MRSKEIRKERPGRECGTADEENEQGEMSKNGIYTGKCPHGVEGKEE